ncbi:hypothetical protein N0V94_007283 [Neodidymelliopsis sp. IMI 364377]|nr:hypothetical protein N0V94_007283 [Neodidymelliopsis sp. IMI 364377]
MAINIVRAAGIPVNDPRLSQFQELAGAMEIRILFDYKWIPTQNYKLFHEILDHPESLSGLPVDGRRKDRHKYVFLKPQISNPIGDGLPEAPPPYSIESSTKRPRQASSTAASPNPKRALLSPVPVGSPTEKATTAPTSSPKAPLSPVACASNFQDAVTNALVTILPDILANLHPDPTASLSPSSSPSSSQILHTNAAPDSNPCQLSRQHSALRKLLGAHGASHASARVEQIFNSAMESALEVRNAGDIEFSEMLQDLIYELTTEKDKAIVEVNDEVDTCLAKMKEDIDVFEQDVFQRIEVKLDELARKALGTSIEGGEHDREKEGDKKRDLRQREKQAREREMEMCEREREIAQRERDVSKREMDLKNTILRTCLRSLF